MGYQEWSDRIITAELAEEPVFSEDIAAIEALVDQRPRHVVLNFNAVDFLSSSNLAALLRLRQRLAQAGRKVVLCGINAQVWGVFLVTGLDKVFEYTDNTATALATVQMDADDTDGA